MDSPKNTIKINGKVYDMVTGKRVGAEGYYGAPKKPIISEMTGGHAQPKVHSPPRPKLQKPRTQAQIQAAKKTEKSLTLMRNAVKKPKLETDHKPSRLPSLPKPSIERITRSKAIPKSQKITKFHHSGHSPRTITPKLEKLEVKEHPKPKPASANNLVDWPVLDRFEQAVQEASSHLETFAVETVKSRSKRKFAYAFASLLLVFVVGLGTYQALPIVKFKMASTKAGFAPSLPSYSPAGFGLVDPINAGHGEVTLTYKSRTDSKDFKITQSPSEWSSQSLENNFLKTSNKQYQAIPSNGKTIYTYDNSSATWVDGGIWFNLEGNANLTQEQLIKIANGL